LRNFLEGLQVKYRKWCFPWILMLL
jgi:hypothetical protein